MGDMPCFEHREMVTGDGPSMFSETGCCECAQHKFISWEMLVFWNAFSVTKTNKLLDSAGIVFHCRVCPTALDDLGDVAPCLR